MKTGDKPVDKVDITCDKSVKKVRKEWGSIVNSMRVGIKLSSYPISYPHMNMKNNPQRALFRAIRYYYPHINRTSSNKKDFI